MSESQLIFPSRLRLAAFLAIGAGVASLALMALFMTIAGRWDILRDVRIFWIWLPRVLVPSAAYIALGVLLARGRYWAMLALMVAGAWELAWQLIQMPLTGRLLNPIHLLVNLAIPATVLAAGLIGRAPVSLYPDRVAVEGARRRARVGLAIAAGLLVLLAGGLVLLAFRSLGSNWSGEDRIIMLVVSGVCALLVVAAVSFVRTSRSMRAGGKPGVGTLVWVFIVCTLALFLVRQTPYAVFSFDTRWIATTLPLAANVVAVWLAVDLLHSRRRTEEPQSYGFAPIFAQPVLPANQGDSHGPSSQR